jgi:hypothetical protein
MAEQCATPSKPDRRFSIENLGSPPLFTYTAAASGGILKAILRRSCENIGPTVAFRKTGIYSSRRELARHALEFQPTTAYGGSLLEDEGWMRKGAVRDAVSEGIERQWIPTQLWYLLVLGNGCASIPES